MLEDAAPGALVLGSAPMAFVDDHEVEEVRGIVPEDKFCHRLPPFDKLRTNGVRFSSWCTCVFRSW